MTHGAPVTKKIDNEDEEIIPPPDGGWGWVVVFGSFMIHIIADGLTYTLGIFIVEFMWYFDEGSEATSWIASIMVGVTLGSGPIVGSLVNKYGCRPITIVGALVASFGLGISTLAQNVETLYVTIGIVAGLGFGLIYLPAIVSVTCYFEKKRSFATGIAVCGSGLGTFIFAPLTEVLIQTYFWKGALLIITALTLNCIIFGALFRPLEMKRKKFVAPDENLAIELVEREKLMAIREETGTSSPSPPLSMEIHEVESVRKDPPLSTNGVTMKENTKNHNLTVLMDSGSRMARSQPHLLQVMDENSTTRQFGSHGTLPKRTDSIRQDLEAAHKKGSAVDVASRAGSGVMYRKDVLYSGSLVNLPEYKADPAGFSGSVIRLPPTDDTHQVDGSGDDKMKVCGCIPCNKHSYYAFMEMMDFSLFKDPIFILFSVSNFCTSIGFNVPYVYIKDKALDLGIVSDQASFLLAVIGIANTVGRVVLGYISDKPWLNRLWLYNASLTICGLATAFSAFCYDYTTLCVYCAVFGATIGAYVGLTSVILVDLLGLDKLTNAFGLLLMFQGIASVIGPPIAGRLKDTLGSYDPGFYVAGTMIALSGLMLFFIPCIQRCIHAQKVRDSTTVNSKIATST